VADRNQLNYSNGSDVDLSRFLEPLFSAYMRILMPLLLICPLLAAEDWPQFLGTRRDGTYKGKVLLPWPKVGPKKLWQMNIGAGFAGPVISKGKLILFHRINNQETVECIEADTGKALWKASYVADYVDDFRFDNGPRAVPAITGNRVFTHGANGMIHAWDLKTGKPLWKVNGKTKYKASKGFFGFACSPLVVKQTLLLNIGGSNGAGIIGLDTNSGRHLWQSTNEPASYASPILSNINNTPQAIFFTREGLISLDPDNGRIHFSRKWRPAMHASVNACTPIVVGNQIFISTSYGKGATLLEADSGNLKTIWASDEAISSHYSSCVVSENYIYGFHGRQEAGADLRCVNLKTGRVLWSQPGLRSGTVTLAGDDLFIMTERGELVRARATPKEFEVKQRARVTRGEVRAFPALADGMFYFRDSKQLVCLQLSSK